MTETVGARLLSVNVGLPNDIAWHGETVHTAVWKRAVSGRRMVRRLNIDGEGQGDLIGHGGEQRAVLVERALVLASAGIGITPVLAMAASLQRARSGGFTALATACTTRSCRSRVHCCASCLVDGAESGTADRQPRIDSARISTPPAT